MKKFNFTIILLIVLGISTLQAQTLVKGEYFYDTDPGVGSGSALSFTAAADITATFSVPVTGLQPGFHKVCMRFKDSNGKWGIAESRTFYVQSTAVVTTPTLKTAEYFYDTDPGVGNGTAVSVPSVTDITATYSASVAGLQAGFHIFGIRYKDSKGKWGITESRTFYVQTMQNIPAAQIVKVAYFVDLDPGTASSTVSSVTPGLSIDYNFGVSALGLSVGSHKLGVRVQDSNGKWSIAEGATFIVTSCSVVTAANPLVGGSTTGDGTYAPGQNVKLQATVNTGYSFVKWTEGGSQVSSTAFYSFNIATARNMVAVFAINSYNIVASASPVSGGSVVGAGTYVYNSVAMVNAIPATGYSFARWTDGGTPVSTQAVYTFNALVNRTLVAVFAINSFNVAASVSPVGAGTAAGSGVYVYNQMAKLTASNNTGYTFSKWTDGGSPVSTTNVFTFNVLGNRNLVAEYAINSYNIAASASPVSGGSVAGAGTYIYNSIAMLNAIPATGYSFARWTDGGTPVSTQAVYTFNTIANRTLVAVFAINSFNVAASVSPAGAGTAAGSGVYVYNQMAKLTATNNTGYTFVRWSEGGTGVSTQTIYTFNTVSNRTLLAEYAANTFLVTTSASPSIGGTVSGAGVYTYNQSITLVATPQTGYIFQKWTENSITVSSSASYSYTVSSTRDLVAVFQLVTSIDTEEGSANITIYPNPSTGTFAIQMSKGLDANLIQIYDLQGKLTKTINKPTEKTNVFLKNRGMYIAKVITPKGMMYKKVIVE